MRGDRPLRHDSAEPRLRLACCLLLFAATTCALTALANDCPDPKLPKLCTTDVIGNDGQTRHKKLCCKSDDECGVEPAGPTSGRWPSPYCKSPAPVVCTYVENVRVRGRQGPVDITRERTEQYNPSSECCTERGVRQKYPITDLEACRKTLAPIPYVREANGCGTRADRVNDHFENVSFKPACDAHDVCYDTCGTSRQECDSALVRDVTNACKSAYKGRPNAVKLKQCLEAADKFSLVGLGDFVTNAFNKSQSAACQCCQ